MFLPPKASLRIDQKIFFSHLLDVFRLIKSFCASVLLVRAIFEIIFMLEICLKKVGFHLPLKSRFGNRFCVVDITT